VAPVDPEIEPNVEGLLVVTVIDPGDEPVKRPFEFTDAAPVLP
jgi:hypothetical protein